MTLFQAFILGLIQGLTEFLPISSSGHLIFVPKIFGWADQGLYFDVVVHGGTLLSLLVYFRKKIWAIIKSCLFMDQTVQVDFSRVGTEVSSSQTDRRLALLILLSVIPAALAGWFFENTIEAYTRGSIIVGISLIVWGILLGAADLYARSHANQQFPLNSVTWKDALVIGVAQVIALIPGTSRSGITMTAGLFRHLDRKSAAEFSFLISIPVIGMAFVYKILRIIQEANGALDILPLVIGFLSAFASGLLAVWLLLKIISRWSFVPFVAYRIVVGILILWIL